MSLPKIATPTFELDLPSSGKIEFRPFLVKEEKILLMARESGDRGDITRALKQIINNCAITEGFDVDKIPLFEMEYIFINLRANSIDDKIRARVIDSDDGKTYEIEVDLKEIKIEGTDPDPTIEIENGIGVKMKYPTAKLTDELKDVKSITDLNYQIIKNSIEHVYDAEDVYPWTEVTDEEKDEFLNSLNVKAYDKLIEFLDSLPNIKHVVTYENSEGKTKRVVFKTLDDFFTWA
jgi:hypothetical protein